MRRLLLIVFLLFAFQVSAMNIKVGTYTGNGVDQSITGIGFEPDFVMVIKSGSNALYKTNTMEGDSCKIFTSGSAYYLSGVKTLDVNGFTVVSVYSVNAQTYYYLAIAGSSTEIATGRYTGTGAEQAITGAGLEPNFVIAGGRNTTARKCWFKLNTHDAGYSTEFRNVAQSNNVIKTMDSDGFTLGTNADVNANTELFQYWAMTEMEGICETFSYTGDGNDDRQLTNLVSFDPDMVWIKSESNHYPQISVAGIIPNSYNFGGSSTADCIQDMIQGGVELGTSVNSNENGTDYVGIAFKTGEATAGGGHQPILIIQ